MDDQQLFTMPNKLPGFSLPILILIFINLGVVTGGAAFSFYTIQRSVSDDKFYQSCIALQTNYREDILAGNIDVSCTQRQWWQLSSQFISPENQYNQNVKKVDTLEQARKAETDELNARIILITQQIAGLQLQIIDSQNTSQLSYRRAIETVEKLENNLKQAQQKKEAEFATIQKMALVYSQSSPEFIQFFNNFKQQPSEQQNIRFFEISKKWEEEKTAWADRLGKDRLSTSVSQADFAFFFSTFKPFTAKEFVDLGDVKTLANANNKNTEVQLFQNAAANDYVTDFAFKRGFKHRISSTNSTVEIQGQKLEPEAATAFIAMQQAAAADGVLLTLTSGFRSLQAQADLFNFRFTQNSTLFGGPFSDEEIASGKADEALAETLKVTSIPSTSKHHSGFAVDIGDGSVNSKIVAFADTKGYKWLLEHNFMNAKRFGFVPSYPEGVAEIGPNPEPWEYVWVGEMK